MSNNQHTSEELCLYSSCIKLTLLGGSFGRLEFHHVLDEVKNDGAKAAGPVDEQQDD